MRGRIILYGWVISLMLMLAGLGTMEWAMETGDPVFLQGLAMFMAFVVFCGLVAGNRDEGEEAADEFDRWLDRIFGGMR